MSPLCPVRPLTPVVGTPVRRIGARDVELRDLLVWGHRIRTAVWPGRTDTPPLLLFNGIGAGLEMLAPFADEMGDRAVVTFDVPGTGESDPPRAPYRLSLLAVMATTILDALGIDRVDALGVSWGGAAVQQFALQNPRRCRRLVLAATTPGVVMVPPSWPVLRKFLTPRRFNDSTYLRAVAAEIYGGKAPDTSTLSSFRRTSRSGYLMQQLAIAGWTSVPWLPMLRQPTLVLAGDDDKVVRLANLRMLAALIPDARLEVLHDGHLFIMSSAQETAALVAQFLEA
jgi:poly(3-hydroxyoctanoate) depolymerase